MTIYIGSKRRGLPHAYREGVRNIDVTSGSMNIVDYDGERVPVKTLSPLKGTLPKITADDGLVYHNFELWWQSQKIYPELGHCVKMGGRWILLPAFFQWRIKWANETVGKRRLPRTKGKVPIGAYHGGKIVDYQQSRHYYLTKYCQAVRNLPAFKALKDTVSGGRDIMIIDLDGPPLAQYPDGHEVTWEFLSQMYTRLDVPFGHGYVVAGTLKFLIEEGDG